MLQSAFGASCINRASVFEWPLREDVRCMKSKDVYTTEWIGQRVWVRVTMLRF